MQELHNFRRLGLLLSNHHYEEGYLISYVELGGNNWNKWGDKDG